jgi:hypothetical protein
MARMIIKIKPTITPRYVFTTRTEAKIFNNKLKLLKQLQILHELNEELELKRKHGFNVYQLRKRK